MAGTQAPSGLREGGNPPAGPEAAGNLRVPGVDTHPKDSSFPDSPCKVGDSLGARVVGGRGPSLNGAPVVKGSAPEEVPVGLGKVRAGVDND